MTYARAKLKTLTEYAETAYRQWYAGEQQRSILDRVEMDLYEYVEGVLAEKNARIASLTERLAELEARQMATPSNVITPEMVRTAREYEAWLNEPTAPTQADLEYGTRLMSALASAALIAIKGDAP